MDTDSASRFDTVAVENPGESATGDVVLPIGMFRSHYRIDRSTACGRPGKRF